MDEEVGESGGESAAKKSTSLSRFLVILSWTVFVSGLLMVGLSYLASMPYLLGTHIPLRPWLPNLGTLGALVGMVLVSKKLYSEHDKPLHQLILGWIFLSFFFVFFTVMSVPTLLMINAHHDCISGDDGEMCTRLGRGIDRWMEPGTSLAANLDRLHWYERGCSLGDPEGCSSAGELCRWTNVLTETCGERAESLLASSCPSDGPIYAYGCVLYGRFTVEEEGLTREALCSARTLYKRGCEEPSESPSSLSCIWRGISVTHGCEEEEAEHDRDRAYLKRQCEEDRLDGACIHLGLLISQGGGEEAEHAMVKTFLADRGPVWKKFCEAHPQQNSMDCKFHAYHLFLSGRSDRAQLTELIELIELIESSQANYQIALLHLEARRARDEEADRAWLLERYGGVCDREPTHLACPWLQETQGKRAPSPVPEP